MRRTVYKLFIAPFKKRKPAPYKAKMGKRAAFKKVVRKSFKPPSTWQKLDTLKLCRQAGIARKLKEKGWLDFVGEIETYINPRLKSALGYAHYERGTIELNKNYFRRENMESRMLQTFVHEVAHHLTHEFMEHRGHGPAWKDTMVFLGYKPARLGDLTNRR